MANPLLTATIIDSSGVSSPAHLHDGGKGAYPEPSVQFNSGSYVTFNLGVSVALTEARAYWAGLGMSGDVLRVSADNNSDMLSAVTLGDIPADAGTGTDPKEATEPISDTNSYQFVKFEYIGSYYATAVELELDTGGGGGGSSNGGAAGVIAALLSG